MERFFGNILNMNKTNKRIPLGRKEPRGFLSISAGISLETIWYAAIWKAALITSANETGANQPETAWKCAQVSIYSQLSVQVVKSALQAVCLQQIWP